MPFDSMWPRDAYGFFDAPATTFFALVASTVTKVASLNPDRNVLIIGANGNAFAAPTSKVTSANGLIIQASIPSLVWTFKDHGNLVQSEWYAFSSTAGVTVTVIEVVLPRSPNDAGGYNVYATPGTGNDEQDDSPYGYVSPGVKPAPEGPDFLSASKQQDYYQLWKACCAGRRRPATLPGRTGGYFDSGGIWHAPTGER